MASLRDTAMRSDPYVRVGMGDNLYRTRVVKDTLHPIFNTTFRMLVHNTANEKLHLYLLDNNKMVWFG
jgi:Ca2+-dependent lipid-binding protein